MSISSLYDSLTDPDTPPSTRLDAAIKDLERYYTAVGNENTIMGYAFDDSRFDAGIIGNIINKIVSAIKGEAGPSIDELRYMRDLIYGSEEGAYFAQDILALSAENLKGVDPDELLDIFALRFESWAGEKSPINATIKLDENAGIRDQTGSTRTVIRQQAVSGSTGETQRLEETVRTPGVGNLENEPPSRINNPNMSALTINDFRLSPANRRTTAGSIFYNCIPTIEMSQCSPFISLTFVSEYNKFITGLDRMTMYGFVGENPAGSLFGTLRNNTVDFSDFLPDGLRNTVDDISTDIVVNTSNGLSEYASAFAGDAVYQEIEGQRSLAASGMDLFQMPQTLNNSGYSDDSSGIIDTSVPLASLQRLSVSIAGLGLATLANKTAVLEFTLHDRSRMPLIAPIIGADSFGGTYVIIEYGWMHQQATGQTVGNVYADYLNSLRDRSIYNIQVADTTLMNDGQVKVRLRLASRGMQDFQSLPVGSGVDHVPASLLSSFFEKALDAIARTKASSIQGEITAMEGVGEMPVNTAALNSQLAQINTGFRAEVRDMGRPRALIPIEDYQGILQGLADPKNEYDQVLMEYGISLIQHTLDAMDAANSDNETMYMTLRSEITAKQRTLSSIDIFNDGNPTQPSLAIQQVEGEATQRVEEEWTSGIENNNGGSSTGPTLGSILLTFVGKTLQSTLKYDEVQFLFYPFNSQAGLMADKNVASFLCNGFEDFISVDVQQRAPFMSISRFMEELFNHECGPENPKHPQFGLEEVYAEIDRVEEELERRRRSRTGAEVTDEDEDNWRQRKRQMLTDALIRVYSNSTQPRQPIFVPPDMTVLTECLPAKIPVGNGKYKVSESKVILRVHIFDAKAGLPYEAQLLQQIITQGEVTTEVQSTSPGNGEGPTERSRVAAALSGFSSRLRGVMDGWIEKGSLRASQPIVISAESGDERTSSADVISYISNVSVREIKDAIKSVTPSITFGGMFTNIDTISMSSNTSGATAQVLLLNATDGNGPSGQQQTDVVEDVFIIPTNATVSGMGFPLAQYGQKFYIDMGTGTTADNFYYVVGITHTITPGSFKTQLTLAYNSNATIKSIRTAMETVVNAEYGIVS